MAVLTQVLRGCGSPAALPFALRMIATEDKRWRHAHIVVEGVSGGEA